MENEKLPEENDVIVFGTGMTESILAAACSRVDKKVLHIDKYDHYGGKWGSFNLKTLRELFSFMQEEKKTDVLSELDIELNEKETCIIFSQNHQLISNIEIYQPEVKNNENIKVLENNFSKCSNITDETTEKKNEYCSNDSKTGTKEKVPIFSEETDEKKLISDSKQESNSKEDILNSPTCEHDENFSSSTNFLQNKNDPITSLSNSSNVSLKKEKTKSELEESFSSFDDMLTKWRNFNIDLLPKMMFSRGQLILLLISSDVARYTEFKIVSQLITLLGQSFVPVPTSKSEIFSTDLVSMVEKRLLMKFLSFALEFQKHPDQYIDMQYRPFKEFLSQRGLSESLQQFIHPSISILPFNTSTLEGLEAVQKYLNSYGRYGNGSLLSPLYGTGELLQCFCRLSAVFGGVYCLRRGIKAIIVDQHNRIKSLVDSEGQKLNTSNLVVEASYAPLELFLEPPKFSYILRSILVTNKFLCSHQNEVILGSVWEEEQMILIQEYSSSSFLCPNNYFLVHLSCCSDQCSLEPLKKFTSKHFNSPIYDKKQDKPSIIWQVYFIIKTIQVDHDLPKEQEQKLKDTKYEIGLSKVKNVFLIGGPDGDLDCDKSCFMAEKLFSQIFPESPFLPKAPKPEEIIFVEENKDNNFDEKEGEEKLT